ncbi:TIGR01621 family pseudouridine synthase [Bermanella marisrubri]|uniref:Pseudouridylate synthases, 23S RNA-specific n=1 Tax=Bermanella marisrubri TaxID=207949 RepID=Q1N0K9_9GAMM|nr:TIGR01621 family pseudouridine synthase [Bermanella marisrubri]EAT11824.1 Pseudouridylate synthases, 23S RNA-specific [Oceanobacter sp. RED65] [Bermanella marisrubri]QIZ83858.1 TIGR01621 family pseudouridine synthase [Bermanella marisrubri]
MSIDIVYEHQDWILVNKPEGVDFHSQNGEVGFHRQLCDQLGFNVFPVHRLDKATSGLLLFAKSQDACRGLVELFSQRKVEKYYLAIVSNKLKKKQGKVFGDMVKSRNGSYKLTQERRNPAFTQFLSQALKPGYRLALLKPKTGKTHQLRVAMKSLGSAIVGDQRYGGESANRLYLHAYALKFDWQGRDYCFQYLPHSGEMFFGQEFDQVMELYAVPWDLKWPS